jgi:aminoglycoside phosphotransferase (APT) family kinase protein
MGEEFDPADAGDIGDAALEAWCSGLPSLEFTAPPERVTAATSTWVWFVEIGGDVPDQWRGRQVLRVFAADQPDVALRERSLVEHLADRGYPVAATRWHGLLGGDHPALLQQRLPGRPAAELLASTKLPKVVRRLGELQAELHAIDHAGLPLLQLTAQGYLDHDLARRRAAVAAHDPAGTWDWLQETSHRVDPAEGDRPVLCHGDFHPLNALVDGDGSIGIVDWTDACIADRHHDVGRSIAIFWFASIVAGNTVERLVLRGLRDWLGSAHRAAYERSSSTSLDDRRLAWWQTVHLYRGWLQLGELAEGTVADRGSSTTERFPVDLRDRLLDRCQALRQASGF